MTAMQGMASMKVVLVEDDERQIQQYMEVLADYHARSSRRIEMVPCRNIDEATITVDSSVDAVVVDLNLGKDTGDGTRVVDELKGRLRVPVAIYTGTPSDADEEPPVVGVFTKGKHGFVDVLERLCEIYDIGLTRIMGGRGLLEERLNRVFLRSLLPSIDVWLAYGEIDAGRTEKALLRFALGHLVADLEGDETPCYPEEAYLSPPLAESITTGTIVRCRKDGTSHVVMTPACDLVVRNGGRKADRVVLADVVLEDAVFSKLAGGTKDRTRRRARLRSNSDAHYYHWLPKSGSMEGGFLDFRCLRTVLLRCFDDEFEDLHARIAPSFIKDVVARFSAFYARQGQPVIRPLEAIS